jgi:hypothetical protein
LVISSSNAVPTIVSDTSAPATPLARVAIIVTTSPNIMMAVPSVPIPAMPAEAGARQLP